MDKEPTLVEVSQCRACGSKNIIKNLVKKSYYLINLDQSIELPYSACIDCQYIFHGHYVGDKFLDKYYKLSPMLRRKEPTSFEMEQSKFQAEFLNRTINLNRKSVLEIGAHAGAFLMYLNSTFHCETYFNELSEEAVKLLSSQPGLRDSSKYPGLKVDVVAIRHTLEHIHDIEGFIAYIETVLKPDGYLFVEVPDWSYLDTNTDPLNFEHLSQFTSHNLIHLMRRLGWSCEALEKSINPNDPATPNRVQRLLFRKLSEVPLGSHEFGSRFFDFYQNHQALGFVRLDKILDQIAPAATIALYPASHLTFSALNETNLLKRKLVGLFDIDEKKHGKIIQGVEVFEAQKLKAVNPDYVFLFTMAYEPEIRESFKKMGIKSEIISIVQILSNDVSLGKYAI